MEAYIDLSIIVFLFNYILSLIYSIIICDNIKCNLQFIFQTIFFAIIVGIINIYFIPYFFIFTMILYSLVLAIFNLRLLKVLIISILLFYFNYGLLLIIGGCYFYDGIILISTPFVTLFILIIPIYVTIIHIIGNQIYKSLKYHKFKYNCKINVENKLIKGKGYYDSGNALLFDDKPVIFVNGNPINNNGEIIHIKGINNIDFTYLAYKGVLSIKDKSISVYIVFLSQKHNFFNCSILLNKFVI